MGGLAIISGNEVKCRPDGIRGKAFFEGKGPLENVILALFKENSRLKDTLPDANPAKSDLKWVDSEIVGEKR
jgi:hypothetical protein